MATHRSRRARLCLQPSSLDRNQFPGCATKAYAMNRRLPGHRSITSAVLLLALLLTPANILPCGTSFPEPVFTVRGSPDAPLELFAQGRLGIVLPTYERTFLVVDRSEEHTSELQSL